MANLMVYWRTPDFDPDEQAKHERRVARGGILTDEHDQATAEQPVLVEDRSDRVYLPGELPPESVIYVQDHPGPLPPLVETARRAGFRVEHAFDDPGVAEHPNALRNPNETEEVGQPRREWFGESPGEST